MCTPSIVEVEDIQAENLIADRGYDTNDIVKAATKAGMQVVGAYPRTPYFLYSLTIMLASLLFKARFGVVL